MSMRSFLNDIGNKRIRLNKRTELFKKGREYALYNALNKEVSYFDIKYKPLIQKLKSPLSRNDIELLHAKYVKRLKGNTKQRASREFWQLLSDLRKKILLVDINFDEEGEITHFQKGLLKRLGTRKKSLLIIPSFDCNYRCKYCFYYGNHLPPTKRLSWDKAKVAVDWFFNQLDIKQGSQKKIQFYGGEPLLNYDLIKDTLNYISQKNAKKRWKKYVFHLSVITNGSLIDEKWIRLFKKHNVNVGVSLDGKRDVNDKMRIDASGKGASDATIRGIRLLNAHRIKPNISITLNKYNLSKLAEQVRWIYENFEVGVVGFSHHIPTTNNPGNIISKRRLIKECSKAFDKLYRWDFFEVEMMKRWHYFIRKTFPPFLCPGHFSQAVLLPDGKIGPCQVYSLTGKNFELLKSSKQNLDTKIWGRWRSASHILANRCMHECNLFMLCGGACPYVAELKTEEFVPYDDARCAFYRMLLEKYIWYGIDKK
jgi:uncharacterized protein